MNLNNAFTSRIRIITIAGFKEITKLIGFRTVGQRWSSFKAFTIIGLADTGLLPFTIIAVGIAIASADWIKEGNTVLWDYNSFTFGI